MVYSKQEERPSDICSSYKLDVSDAGGGIVEMKAENMSNFRFPM